MPDLLTASEKIANDVENMVFADPVAHVYNPLQYAWDQYKQYIAFYGHGKKKVIFLGMNPGPWGMAQTGIPFGEVSFARDWLHIEGPVCRPPSEHPRRPIEGFSCQRSEVSGRRLWTLFSRKFGTAENFFKDHFVSNYCPLVFMEATGRNRTPDKLKADEKSALFEACNRHLVETVVCLQPEWLIGIGGFAEKRFAAIKEELDSLGLQPKIGKILHPSPASPAANRGWEQAAEKQMAELGIWP